MTNKILADIRRCDPDLADAIDREELGMKDVPPGGFLPPEFQMSEEQLARVDAWLFGQGYLVDGRRVAPDRVVIVRAP